MYVTVLATPQQNLAGHGLMLHTVHVWYTTLVIETTTSLLPPPQTRLASITFGRRKLFWNGRVPFRHFRERRKIR